MTQDQICLIQSPTVTQAIKNNAKLFPDKTAITFLHNGEDDERIIDYATLDHKARIVAQKLIDQGAGGKTVLIAYPSGLEYIIAFLGCLYAKVVAVPLYPPQLNKVDRRFQSVIEDSNTYIVLTTAKTVDEISRLEASEDVSQYLSIKWDTIDDLHSEMESLSSELFVESEDLAFLQYTSGSTSAPKGVMVTHGNIIANVNMMVENLEMPKNMTSVSWLPLFHDMGLIGAVLKTVVRGEHLVLMSPLSFLKKPIRWMKAVSKYKAYLTVGPDFAYDLCVKKIKPEQAKELDLSSLSITVTGAEPIRWKSIQAFYQHFKDSGFRLSSFFPAYGLAEATLLVSTNKPNEEPTYLEPTKLQEETKEQKVTDITTFRHGVVSCGRAVKGMLVRSVDPQTGHEVPEGEIGEMWLAGPNVAKGYWQKADITEKTFQARLVGDEVNTYFRTGDLGFIVDQEIYITGRIKDTMIIRGQNHYPQDIEMTVEASHPEIKSHVCAAFSVKVDEEEQLVIVAEVMNHRNVNAEEVILNMKKSLLDDHGIQAYAIVLCSSGAVPKTTSGKVMRSYCKELFLQESLAAVYVTVQNREIQGWGK